MKLNKCNDCTVPEGYMEIVDIENVYYNPDNGEIVICGIPDSDDEEYNGEIVICGIPDSDDEELHNCDQMGCGSLSHVLIRCTDRRMIE